jgi:ABC-2 type transport system ATP-binding protein
MPYNILVFHNIVGTHNNEDIDKYDEQIEGDQMSQVEVSHISKSFGNVEAVRDVNFEVGKGEIFGLLGPNGAGKTTTIRVMLDIFKPERGTVSILGGPMSEKKKDLIGYMPEERGLYQDIPLERCLVYLGTLKGLSASEAQSRLQILLDRFDLTDHKKKKVKELSKGMQQKAQIIAAILHNPELIIIDEPFTSLDPINTQLVKDLMRELHKQGVTLIMSTHQMHQVEELCDRILLINEGKNVLYGNLETIRREHAGHAVMVRASGEIPRISSVESMETHNSTTKLILNEGSNPQDVLADLVAQDVNVEKFEIALPTLDEIFIQVVQE